MNTHIYTAAVKQKSSEAIATEQMILSFFANVWEDSDEVHSLTGRLFHVAGPDTAKSRQPRLADIGRWGCHSTLPTDVDHHSSIKEF